MMPFGKKNISIANFFGETLAWVVLKGRLELLGSLLKGQFKISYFKSDTYPPYPPMQNYIHASAVWTGRWCQLCGICGSSIEIAISKCIYTILHKSSI